MANILRFITKNTSVDDTHFTEEDKYIFELCKNLSMHTDDSQDEISRLRHKASIVLSSNNV